MNPQSNPRVIIYMVGIATILFIGLYDHAFANGPLAIWGYVEGATPMPIENHHFGGVGGSVGLEFALANYLSLYGGVCYVGLGKDRSQTIITDNLRDAYRKVNDLRTDFGAKVYFTDSRIQPYFGLAVTYHDLRYSSYRVHLDGSIQKLSNIDRTRDFGFAPWMGIKAMVKERWFLEGLVAMNLATGYEYFTFKIGLGYSFLR